MKRILIPVALMLSACDPTPPPQPETERQPNPVFETQIQAVEKAEEVTLDAVARRGDDKGSGGGPRHPRPAVLRMVRHDTSSVSRTPAGAEARPSSMPR